MPARIFCKVGQLRGVTAEIADEATLGRSRKATVRLQAELVSGEHARIRYEPGDGCYVLEDLGSTNGTALDGVRVRGREPLGHLHLITVAGEYDFIFQDLERCALRHGTSGSKAFEPPSENTDADGAVLSVPQAILDGAAVEPPKEVTHVEDAPFVLPAALADLPADAGRPGERKPAVEGTDIFETPVQVPSFLAEKADQISPEPSAPEPEPEPEKPTVKLAGPIEEEEASARESGTVTEDKLEELLLGESEELAGAQRVAVALAVGDDDGDVRYLALQEGENLLGRGDTCAVRIDSADVSRRHALLTVTGDVITLRDLGSSNHTFVEGTRLERDIAAPLKPGARLKFGGVRARLICRGRTVPKDEP